MIDMGTQKPGSTIRIPFSTYDKDDGSSASILAGTYTTGDIVIHKDGSTTERAGVTGLTATTDFDGRVGMHYAIIDTSNDTIAGFYAAGSQYDVAVYQVTVDTIVTHGWVGRFRLGYPGAILDTHILSLTSQTQFILNAGPAEANALVGCPIVLHDVASAVQWSYAYIATYAATTKEVTLRSAPSFTIAATDNVSVFLPTDTLALPIPAAPVADSVYERIRTIDDNLTTDIYAIFSAMRAGSILTTIRSGTTPTTGSFQLPDGSFTADDQLNGAWCVLLTEPPIARKISDSVVATQTLTFAGVGASVADRAFPSAPAANTPLMITGLHGT